MFAMLSDFMYCFNLLLKQQVLVGQLSAVQPPFDINFPWSLGFIRKKAFGSP